MKQDRYRYPLPPQNISALFPKAVSGHEPISDLADFWLRVECPDDGQTLVPLRLLCAKIGWKVTLNAVVSRLKCSHCGGRPSSVSLLDRTDGDGHSTKRAGEIVLRQTMGGRNDG